MPKRPGTKTALTPTEREDLFYEFLAGEARSSLLTSIVQMGLPALLADRGPMTEQDIIDALALHPQRGRKWLLLLRYVNLLEEAPKHTPRATPRYGNSPLVQALFMENGRGGYFYRDFLRYWNRSRSHDIAHVLRGGPVPESVPYPPKTMEDTRLLHEWMRTTAEETFAKIRKHVDFGRVGRLLDVAGGDGTMASRIVAGDPNIRVTVFNLPAAAVLARQRIAEAGAMNRVRVVEGDFFTDRLPRGFDMVMFSRVLADWPRDTCRMLLSKAHASLRPGGRLVICEPLSDDNQALTIAWEHSYLPYDDFGCQLYKPLEIYRELLRETGFSLDKVHGRDRHSIHSVLIAKRR
ncbi:MAG: methyltransferase [Nitrospirota bacterium]|nr:methyltransferase [Nitrospirota bacterium]